MQVDDGRKDESIVTRKHLWTLLPIIALMWAMFNPSFPPQSTAYAHPQTVINTDVLNVRGGPGLNYSVISKVTRGETFSVIQEQEDWIEIRLSDNESGWVAREYTELNQEEPIPLVRSRIDGLNVRSGPSTTFPVVQTMTLQDAYPLVETEGDWLEIRLAENVTGWVATWLTTTTQESKSYATRSVTQVTIATPILNVRSGPGVDNQQIGQLQNGDIVTVLEVKDNWYKIEYNGSVGWVASEYATRVNSTDEIPKVQIIEPETNLRSGPGTNHGIVTTAQVGEQFPIVSTVGDWYKIELSSGKQAYVAGWIVTVKGMNPIMKPKMNTFLKGKVIVIDPGHGGKDVGATGTHFKTNEKDLNLKVSKLLKKKLESAGASVILTRDRDVKIPLLDRVYISHKNKADMFISVHHNTHENSRISGTITYYYAGTNDKDLAVMIQKELVKNIQLKDRDARQGDYYVLRENAQLAVIVEIGFLTNYEDELKLRTARFQEKSAEGIFQGVIKYYQKKEGGH